MGGRQSANDRVLTNAATGVTIRIVRSTSETNGDFLELQAEYPRGSAAPPLHLHPYQHEQFVIKSGTMTAIMDGRTRALRTGSELAIPPGSTHAMWNAGSQPSIVKWISTPALRTEAFFRDVYWLAAESRVNTHGTPGILDLAWLVPRYWNEIRVTRSPAIVQRVLFGLLTPFAWFRTGPPSDHRL